MSADRPSTALDPGHPLHSILSGFTEPPDDVLADDDRSGDGATVDPGPPRPPSAGRPLDDAADDAPFTPPIPVAGLRDLLGDTDASPDERGRVRTQRGASLDALLATRPAFPRPSPRVAAALLAATVAVAAVASGGRGTTPEPRDAAPSFRAAARPASEAAARAARGGRRPPARGDPAHPARRSASRPARVSPATSVPTGVVPRAATVPPPSAAAPLAASPGSSAPVASSRFTSEFTP